MIPQANPGASFNASEVEFLNAARRVLSGGSYILGEEGAAFERHFATWLGVGHAVGCANGTDAIELILRGLGVLPGHVVFTVSHTAVATVAAVERAGATPWMVDIDHERLTMSPAALAEAIRQCCEKRPDLTPWAVLPVHIYGQAADMEPILTLAKQHGLFVVEDCAQSHGSRYQGHMTGTMGHASAFSLYPTKNLGAFGDAGVIATDDGELAERLCHLRQYGWKERYISAVSGINSRLDPLQAAFLNIKLKTLAQDNAARRRIAALYDELLTPLERAGRITLCKPAPGVEHVYHQYVIRTSHREELRYTCAERGVGTAIHYPMPVHAQPAYHDRNKFPAGEMTETEAAAREVLSLPMFPQLAEEDVRTAASAILTWGSGE